MRDARPAKEERVVTRAVVATSGGGRTGWVRNSGYVTIGGRSAVERVVVDDGGDEDEELEDREELDEAAEDSVTAICADGDSARRASISLSLMPFSLRNEAFFSLDSSLTASSWRNRRAMSSWPSVAGDVDADSELASSRG